MVVHEDPLHFTNELELPLVEVKPVPEEENMEGVGESVFEHDLGPSHVSREPPPSFEFAGLTHHQVPVTSQVG